tara:strand:+ start:13628 stop:15214 length:1587 start_codon:yes stop_codon:yes gene_type:complete
MGQKKIKVCIPTAGIGTRLGNLTKNLNKSLVEIDLKPAIAHIIDKFPTNSEFVIPLGYKGELVKNFLKIAYPKKKFYFVNVKKFKGKGSGLGLTLLKAKKYLQSPFIFVSCDTIFEGKIPSLSKNWIGYSEKKNMNEYRGIGIDKKKIVLKFLNKKFNSGKYNKTYIGLAGIKDFQQFWKNMETNKSESIELGEIYGLNKLNNKIHAKKFIWNDIGNLAALNATKKKIKNNNKKFNILNKKNEKIWFIDNQIIKYFENDAIVKKRVRRAKILQRYIPTLLKSTKNFYSYRMYNGTVFSKINNLNVFKKLLNYIWQFHNISKKNLNANYKQKCMNFYKKKTFDRIKLFYKKFNLKDNSSSLNKTKTKKLKDLLNKLDWNYLAKGKIANFHGDLHFENILYSKKNKTFKLLDWREDFSNDIRYGDIYYDYAKLMHGILVSHEMVRKDKFKVLWNSNNIHFSIQKKKIYTSYLKYYLKWLQIKGLDIKKINLLTGLIFLNIAPLHHHPYSLFLYAIGKNIINNKYNYKKIN